MIARFVRKDHSWFMRAIGWLLETTTITPHFMTRFWTTIGNRIYYPIDIVNPKSPQYKGIRDHEEMHVEQAFHLGCGCWVLGTIIMAFAYILFPLPVFFSGRWLLEREPYLHDIQTGRVSLEYAVETLHKNYLRPWPKKWMKKWFENHLEE